ncbi:hypothetical protein HYH03_013246, partial [Edaphochlamys debaryana]
MDWLRWTRFLAEADAIRPGLGSELGRFQPLTTQEMDQAQDLLDQYKKAEASQLAVQAEHRRQRDEYHRL